MGETDGIACRICGCTEDYGCAIGGEDVCAICHWVEPDLCSTCAPVAAIISEIENINPPSASRLRCAANEYLDMLDKPRI